MCSWLVTLLSLLALGEQCLSCNSSITVMITGNTTMMTLPTDNDLTLETNLDLPIMWTIGNQNQIQCTNQTSCPYPGALDDGSTFNVTVTNGSITFLLNVAVNDDAVVCRDLTSGILLPPYMERSCYPVSSCNSPSMEDLDSLRFRWEIGYNNFDDWRELEVGPYMYMPPASTGLMSEEGDNMVVILDGGMTLNITGMTDAMVGYYRVVGIHDDGAEMTLSSFTVFLRVMYEDTYRLSVNVVEGRNEIFIPCHFESFPQVSVTWQRVFEDGNTTILDDSNTSKYTFVNINETEDEITGSTQNFDLTLTLNGGLIIHDVVIEDRGVYECVGSNGFVSTTESLIFRVRDHLRPLWPALGIIGVFIVTSMFIATSYLIERIKEDKERTIGPSEVVDGEQEATAFQGRPSIISMDADEENSTVQKRIHSDGFTK